MPPPNPPNPFKTPSRALLTSLFTYPLLFTLITPLHSSSSRFTKSREALSVLHCTFITLLSAHELRTHFHSWSSTSISHPPSLKPSSFTLNHDTTTTPPNPGSNCPMITTRSNLGNSIMAFELGYLLQDSVILILAAKIRARERARVLRKEINWRVLGWHHVGTSSALAVLQLYIARGKEKGILVILMFMLMNASSPIGTLHWYLVNFQPLRKRAIVLANALYLMMYAVCRVAIVPWILHVFGSQAGYSTIEAFRSLRMACQLGTATIGISNLTWFVLGISKFFARYQSDARSRKGI